MQADDLVPKSDDPSMKMCPEDCGWWVPAGMEYLAADHDCDDHPMQ